MKSKLGKQSMFSSLSSLLADRMDDAFPQIAVENLNEFSFTLYPLYI